MLNFFFFGAKWVAPLGSAALIFNFIFAKMLVGTNIERKDILGTFVVVASVIWIVVFGGINGGDDRKLCFLYKLWSKFVFVLD